MEQEEIKCEICNKKFSWKNPKTSLIKHQVWCKAKREFLNKFNLDKEKLNTVYSDYGSVLGFKEAFPFWKGHTQYYRLFKEFDIDISSKNGTNSKQSKNKRKETNLKLYGSEHNFKRNSPSRIEWQKRLFDEEGITNVFQRKEVIEKSMLTILEKYGTEFYTKHISSVRGMNVISSLNKKIFDILKENEINFSIEHKIKISKEFRSSKNNYYFSYDILLENKKLIEVNGDYWHGNPKIYKPDDLIMKNSSAEIRVGDKWIKDKRKNDFAISNGYQLMVIWEDELKNNKNQLIEKIKNYAKN